jgi:NAD(P)-dependent dehydrogenase (short-subunit alcohol dehydrogenase family)
MGLELSGGVAVITGAASGIGLALAKACAAAGMRLALTDISAERLAAASATVAGDHIVLQHDVTDPAAWEAVASRIEAELGPPLVLFNNAGVVGAPAPVVEHSKSVWDWLIATNLTAAFLGARTFAPAMVAAGRGHIVVTASIQSLLASPGFGGYTAAKFGLLGLSETLRAELAPQGVGVSVICPGATRTQLFANSRSIAPECGLAGANPREAIRHYLEPDDIAAAALDAVRANRFYVITHPEYRTLHEARIAALSAAFAGTAAAADVANIEEVEHAMLAAYVQMMG